MTRRQYGPYTVETSREEKIFFPEAGLTKGDVIDYYDKIAKVMLPHLKDRPLSMHRWPDGIDGKSFYQKDVPDHFPDWIETVTLKKSGGTVDYAVCNNQATLVYLADQACLVPHPWLSRKDRPNVPDRLVFDFDPAGEAGFDLIRDAARRVQRRLEEAGLMPFVMTTGSSGLHVWTPLTRRADFDNVREFAQGVADAVAAEDRGSFTRERRIEKRGDRVFIDVARNAYAQTAVAPYSIRAKPGAPVAAPLDWDEVDDPDLHPRRWTIRNIRPRIEQKGDPWAGMARHARSLPG